MGYKTTREPQKTQALWLTDPAKLALPHATLTAPVETSVSMTWD